MKATWKKLLALALFLFFLAPITLGISLYFSRDTSELLDKFPRRNPRGDLPFYLLLDRPPKSWVPLKRISPFAQSAVILAEDWSFYVHDGFDQEQMRIAVEEALAGKRFRGASTITQQLVKNVWLTSERTLTRKLRELILAWKVDRDVPKKRILELYLNIVEFGPGLYGIGPATQRYFAKTPAELTPREAAFLAMLLPSPRRYSISFKKKKLTPFAQERIRKILEKMRMGKAITPEEFEAEVQKKFSWEEI